jgi:hypothetical protein
MLIKAVKTLALRPRPSSLPCSTAADSPEICWSMQQSCETMEC